MKLDTFRNDGFSRGAPRVVELAWIILSGVLFTSFLPGSGWRRTLLRLFGARIGKGVIIKSRVQIKFPWRLVIGSHCWIGENVWIDNLAQVTLADNVCVSQGAYLCTGSHDWTVATFDLITKPIIISSHAWVGAFAVIAPGTVIEEGAVLSMGSVGSGTFSSWTIFRGDPAEPIKPRVRG